MLVATKETNELKFETEEFAMSRRSSNTPEVPQAKDALDRFKFEVANEMGVPLKHGYNGDLTSRENGSVGGEMVRQMIRRQEAEMADRQ